MSTVKPGDGVVRIATGKIDPTASEAITVTLGFAPRHVVVMNEDLVERWEKNDQMPAAASLKTVTAGTTTYDANSRILFTSDGFILDATLAGDGDNVTWTAWG